MVERGPSRRPSRARPGIFALGDPDGSASWSPAPGFDEPEIEPIEIAWKYPDVDEHWELTMKLAGPLAEAIAGIDEAEREAIRGRWPSRAIEPLIAGGRAA